MFLFLFGLNIETIISSYGQGYKNILSNFLDGSVSLHPLTTSIQELAYAAKEAENEAKVKSINLFWGIHILVKLTKIPM